MIDDHIQDGDIIILEKQETAENGQSIVAMINGERVTLKRFYVEADGAPTSQPEHRAHLCAPRGTANPWDRGRRHTPELMGKKILLVRSP